MPKDMSYETQPRTGHLSKPTGNTTQKTGREIPKESQAKTGHLVGPDPAPGTRRTDKVSDVGSNGPKVPEETQERTGHLAKKGGR